VSRELRIYAMEDTCSSSRQCPERGQILNSLIRINFHTNARVIELELGSGQLEVLCCPHEMGERDLEGEKNFEPESLEDRGCDARKQHFKGSVPKQAEV